MTFCKQLLWKDCTQIDLNDTWQKLNGEANKTMKAKRDTTKSKNPHL